MPRIARVVVPGLPHHITHRGIRRSDVFWDEADRLQYFELFGSASRRFLLRIWAYCLMTNHVHFVAVPELRTSIYKVFHWTNGKYDRYFNAKYGLTGNLWESRPDSTVLSEDHTMAAVRYVERNPVRARMVPNAVDYKWSSARVRCGLACDSLLDPTWRPERLVTNWADWLTGDDDKDMEETIRRSTSTGRPSGDESFVRNVEQLTGRSLAKRKSGRKRKPEGSGSGFLWKET